MNKNFLSGRLSKKTTFVAIVCVIVFVLAGIIAAVCSHVAFVNGEKAEIVNYSSSPSSAFHLRTGKVSDLVYKYGDKDKTVDIDKVIELPSGASYKIVKVLDRDLQPIAHEGTVFQVENGERYFVFLTVLSNGGLKKQNYTIELVRLSDYSAEDPDFNVTDIGDKQYIIDRE